MRAKRTSAKSVRAHQTRTTVPVDVHGLPADAAVVHALARVQLAVRGHGGQISLRRESAELRRLIALMGLEDVLPG